MKAGALQRLLETELGYYVHSQRGSHKKLRSNQGYQNLTFAFHDGLDLAPGVVRSILVKQAGLTVEAASQLLGIR